MKIGVIGTTGEGKETSSGQEIRTKILVDALIQHYGAKSIYVLETGLIKKSKWKALISLLKCILTCKDIVLIVSRNGLHTFLPILSFCQKFLGKRIYNNIIGGNILELIKENPKYPDYMRHFVVNWVQMNSLVLELKKIGILNAEVLPNSKPIRQISLSDTSLNNETFRFCTFSRISKAKGIELAIEAVEKQNYIAKKNIAILDIYGAPDEDYKEEFDKVLEKSSSCIHYKGVVPYDRSPDVLSQYYMLLFPTTFYGEGFPGTILDAYASGLPVIASDWKFNPELIEEGKTGFLYPHDDPNALTERIRQAIEHPEVVNAMRKDCLKEAEKYTPEMVMPIIFEKIDSLRK